jgi:MFS family permease
MFSKGFNMNQIKAYVLSFTIVIITFVVSAIAAGMLADFFGVWKKPIIGSVAASFVVLSGYITAPDHKQKLASAWLVIGAVAAWFLSSTSPYPEDKPTLFPLYATYASGLITLLLCMVWHKKQCSNQ